MAKFKEGDRVQVIERPVTADDRKANRYFEHMQGLTGTVQNVFGPEEIAVKVDLETLSEVARDVHTESLRRMRMKVGERLSETLKSKLSPEEANFSANYIILVRAEDLKKA